MHSAVQARWRKGVQVNVIDCQYRFYAFNYMWVDYLLYSNLYFTFTAIYIRAEPSFDKPQTLALYN